MDELKKIGRVFLSKFVGTGPSFYEKRIYRAAVSQRLRNTAVKHMGCYAVPAERAFQPQSVFSVSYDSHSKLPIFAQTALISFSFASQMRYELSMPGRPQNPLHQPILSSKFAVQIFKYLHTSHCPHHATCPADLNLIHLEILSSFRWDQQQLLCSYLHVNTATVNVFTNWVTISFACRSNSMEFVFYYFTLVIYLQYTLIYNIKVFVQSI